MPDAYRIVSPRCVAAKTLGWHDPAAEMNAALAKQPDKIRAVSAARKHLKCCIDTEQGAVAAGWAAGTGRG